MALRAGFQLKLLPAGSDSHDQWVSVNQLQQRKWDDQSDPTGHLRRAEQYFQELQQAYQRQAIGHFNRASRTFLALLKSSEERLHVVPDRRRIALELGYNRWMPMRLAVGLILGASAVVVAVRTGWRFWYRAGLIVFAAGLLALLAAWSSTW